MKYLDFEKIIEIIINEPDSIIEAGTQLDWKCTSSILWDGQFHRGCYTKSIWDTPQIKITHDNNKQTTLTPYTTKPKYNKKTYTGESIQEIKKQLQQTLKENKDMTEYVPPNYTKGVGTQRDPVEAENMRLNHITRINDE